MMMLAADLPIAEQLAHFPLFSNITADALQSLAPLFSEQHFHKDAVIFYEQDSPEKTGARVYFLREGCVKLVKYSTHGESTIVRLVTPGEFFGVTGAINKQVYPFSAEALTDISLLSLPSEAFSQLIHQAPQVALNIMQAMGEVLWFNYATHNQVVKKSEARVAKIILYHLMRDGSVETPEGLQLKINLPHDYIASMTGIAYEESVRIVSRLKKQYACIQYLRGGKILITNPPALKRIAQEQEIS